MKMIYKNEGDEKLKLGVGERERERDRDGRRKQAGEEEIVI